MRLSEIQTKKIFGVMTGKNIGNIVDVDIGHDGSIEYLIIEHGKNLFNLNRDSDSRISWNDIDKIGEDVILVKNK